MSRATLASVRRTVGFALFTATMWPAHAVTAQSLPPVTKAHDVANRAVVATNAHTAAMTTEPGSAATQRTSPPAARPDTARPVVPGRSTQSAAGSAAIPKAPASTPVERASFEREIYNYAASGRRDPFVSLMASGDLRPVITDIVVSGILFNAGGSVAILRDVSTKTQYRVHVGQSLGRIRVARIEPKSVTFTIEEFGYSRQETLPLGDPNKVRKQ
jgi:hypothetical protein